MKKAIEILRRRYSRIPRVSVLSVSISIEYRIEYRIEYQYQVLVSVSSIRFNHAFGSFSWWAEMEGVKRKFQTRAR